MRHFRAVDGPSTIILSIIGHNYAKNASQATYVNRNADDVT